MAIGAELTANLVKVGMAIIVGGLIGRNGNFRIRLQDFARSF